MEKQYEELLKQYEQALQDNKELISLCKSFKEENKELTSQIESMNKTLKKYHELCNNYSILVREQQNKMLEILKVINKPKTFEEVYYETIREILS